MDPVVPREIRLVLIAWSHFAFELLALDRTRGAYSVIMPPEPP